MHVPQPLGQPEIRVVDGADRRPKRMSPSTLRGITHPWAPHPPVPRRVSPSRRTITVVPRRPLSPVLPPAPYITSFPTTFRGAIAVRDTRNELLETSSFRRTSPS